MFGVEPVNVLRILPSLSIMNLEGIPLIPNFSTSNFPVSESF